MVETNDPSPPRLQSNYTRYLHSWHFVLLACFVFGFIFKSNTAFADALVTYEDPAARGRHPRQGQAITSHSKLQDAPTYLRPRHPPPPPPPGNKVPHIWQFILGRSGDQNGSCLSIPTNLEQRLDFQNLSNMGHFVIISAGAVMTQAAVINTGPIRWTLIDLYTSTYHNMYL